MALLLKIFELQTVTDLAESDTKMMQCTYIATSLSTLLSAYSLNFDSILEDLIQTSDRFHEVTSGLTTTPERMVTSSPNMGNLRHLLTLAKIKTTEFGRRHYANRLKLTFLTSSEAVLRRITSSLTARSNPSRTNTLEHARNHTDRQPLSILAETALNASPIRPLSETESSDTDENH